MKPAKLKLKVISLDYYTGPDGNLVQHPNRVPKPWAVFGEGMISRHRTHAKAIRHACKLAKKRGKK